MRKMTYEQAALICLYNGITNTISELESHYKQHPSKSIKEEILMFLEQQRDCLKVMKKAGINKYFFKSLSVNAKRLMEKSKLKEKNKIINTRTVSGAGLCAFSVLIASLVCNNSLSNVLANYELISDMGDDIDFFALKSAIFDEIEVEQVEVQLEPIVGTQIQCEYKVATLVQDKYYDIACPEDLQDYFYELEEKWDIPADLGMLLVDKESDGTWATNGVISPTNDYGLSQINITNHAYIKRHLGYTSNDLLYDQYKNLDAMYLLLQCIFDHYGYTKDNYDLENVAGTYNGWTGWRDYEQSVEYVQECINIYNTKFTKSNDVKLLVNEF